MEHEPIPLFILTLTLHLHPLITPQDSYANRDTTTTAPPLLAFSARTGVETGLTYDDNMFFLSTYPQSYSHVTLHSAVAYTRIPLATLLQPDNYTLSVDTVHTSQIHRSARAGGRISWVATILFGQTGNYVQQRVHWTTEDTSFEPGSAKAAGLATYVKWLIGGVILVIAVTAIIIGKVCYDRAQERKLEREGKATTLNEDIVRGNEEEARLRRRGDEDAARLRAR